MNAMDLAREMISRALAHLDDQAHIDDLAATHTRAVQVFEVLGEPDRANVHRTTAVANWTSFKRQQSTWLESLGELDALYAESIGD